MFFKELIVNRIEEFVRKCLKDDFHPDVTDRCRSNFTCYRDKIVESINYMDLERKWI